MATLPRAAASDAPRVRRVPGLIRTETPRTRILPDQLDPAITLASLAGKNIATQPEYEQIVKVYLLNTRPLTPTKVGVQ